MQIVDLIIIIIKNRTVKCFNVLLHFSLSFNFFSVVYQYMIHVKNNKLKKKVFTYVVYFL